ncbi:toxin VasX [Marinobacter alexandrii]|uniref:toxin VasX n=1 Tax=Marinobacter alexandrii TaxID=2570351 RepID=UPI00110960C9|nr:toxin VasX [Marinobacter alexandrii]
MTNTLSFMDETLENSVRRRAEYDDSNPGELVLSVPKRAGGHINLTLLEHAQSNVEQDEHQENTLLRIKPLAELAGNLPVKSGGLTFHTGRAVALLRPGYLYVFRGDVLWRELEIDTHGLMSDIDLQSIRLAEAGAGKEASAIRASEGKWLSNILVPVLLQGRAVINEIRVAYSEVQWDWRYITRLEQDTTARLTRTSGIEHAWPAATVEDLVFKKGYPASNIANVNALRARDLGMELMLENPAVYRPDFETPDDTELCMRLNRRLEQIASDDGYDSVGMDFNGDADEDRLQELRSQKGVVGVSIPDPLFQLRHSLAQLHLALHYLDAVDASIKQKPMAHSAMLIRQAVFDPLTLDGKTDLQKYADAIDKEKLDAVLDTKEKDHAVAVINRHVERLQEMMKSSVLAAVLDDYRECGDLAICEGYLLIADKLNLFQQIPGVLRANGFAREDDLFKSLKRWLFDSDFLTGWAPQSADTADDELSEESKSAHDLLLQLTEDRSEITEEMLGRLNLQSLAYLEKQLHDREAGDGGIVKNISDAGKVGSLVARALEEWSTAVLKVGERLMEEGVVSQVEIQRVMQSAASNFTLADPALAGITIVNRGGVEASGTILGVRGEGLNRGLTEFDRTEGILTRKNDYLYADLIDNSGEMMGSTSPSRAADELETAIQKVAGPALVFYAPTGHSEAKKLSLIKVDLSKNVSGIVDGPAVSRGLVVLAAFNVFVELKAFNEGADRGSGRWPLLVSRFVSAAVDLTAASLKLTQVLGEIGGAQNSSSRSYRIATRPLFDVKNWFFIGNRLQKLGASTLVRTVGLASFIAGAATAVLSCIEMGLSFYSKDFDAAIGHAVALAGGLIYLAHPLMATLLAVPGWGWAVIGMGMVIGGSLYASNVTDDPFENLLKRGPLGLYPNPDPGNAEDSAYFGQLITLLSPISINVQTYRNIAPDLEFSQATNLAAPEDYVVTVRMPLVSRLLVSPTQVPGIPKNSFSLAVQEIAYASTSIDTYGAAGTVKSHYMQASTPLKKVVARQSLPGEGGVRFLVKKELQNGYRSSWGYDESIWTTVRVGVQAVVSTEQGPLVLPSPVNDQFELFDLSRHGNPPAKERNSSDPLSQPDSPYWFFTEVEV